MSTEQGKPVPLGEWITALVASLAAGEPHSYQRLTTLVGARRACIQLDDEAVLVRFVRGRLTITPATTIAGPVEGSGVTTAAVVVALLDGTLSATDALRSGQIWATGRVDDLARMLHAIELLLDASPRCPALRALADQFRAARSLPQAGQPRTVASPTAEPEELELLDRLGLLSQEPA